MIRADIKVSAHTHTHTNTHTHTHAHTHTILNSYALPLIHADIKVSDDKNKCNVMQCFLYKRYSDDKCIDASRYTMLTHCNCMHYCTLYDRLNNCEHVLSISSVIILNNLIEFCWIIIDSVNIVNNSNSTAGAIRSEENLPWHQFLGEMQRIAFRLMLSSCVSVCVSVCLSVCVCMPRLWTSGKRFEIEMPFFFYIARNDTGHNL